MISTIERDFKVENGVASFPMKEYPDWYGIKDIGFIWQGSWSDHEIEYKGKRINANIIEDTMWEMFQEESEKSNINIDDDNFIIFMRENADCVYELIELLIEDMN